MFLTEMKQKQPKRGAWPIQAGDGEILDILFDLCDAEFNSEVQVHRSFENYQAGEQEPVLLVHTLWAEKVRQVARNHDLHGIWDYQAAAVAFALLASWIETYEEERRLEAARLLDQ